MIKATCFFTGSKAARADTLTTHIGLQPSLKKSGSIRPLNQSPSMKHIGTLFYPKQLPMYLSLKRSHPLWSSKENMYRVLTLYKHNT